MDRSYWDGSFACMNCLRRSHTRREGLTEGGMKMANRNKADGPAGFVQGGDAGVAGELPVERSEDVEFSMEMADDDDLAAQERADAANCRVMGEPDNG